MSFNYRIINKVWGKCDSISSILLSEVLRMRRLQERIFLLPFLPYLFSFWNHYKKKNKVLATCKAQKRAQTYLHRSGSFAKDDKHRKNPTVWDLIKSDGTANNQSYKKFCQN